VDDLQRLVAIEDIRRAKTRYWNGLDLKDPALLRSAFDDRVKLDYRLSPADPKTPASYFTDAEACVRTMMDILAPYASSHQGHSVEVDFVSDTEADVRWSFSDHFWFKSDDLSKVLPNLGHRYKSWGHYHERYRKAAGGWRIATLRFTTLHIERG
jgi:hypothetical protein